MKFIRNLHIFRFTLSESTQSIPLLRWMINWKPYVNETFLFLLVNWHIHDANSCQRRLHFKNSHLIWCNFQLLSNFEANPLLALWMLLSLSDGIHVEHNSCSILLSRHLWKNIRKIIVCTKTNNACYAKILRVLPQKNLFSVPHDANNFNYITLIFRRKFLLHLQKTQNSYDC